MRTTLLVLALIMGTQALAQDAVFPPQSLLVSQHPQDQFTIAPNRETKPRIFDRKFLLLAGIATTATVLDGHDLSLHFHLQPMPRGKSVGRFESLNRKTLRHQPFNPRRSNAGQRLVASRDAAPKIMDGSADCGFYRSWNRCSA